jgi:hypothetical protein
MHIFWFLTITIWLPLLDVCLPYLPIILHPRIIYLLLNLYILSLILFVLPIGIFYSLPIVLDLFFIKPFTLFKQKLFILIQTFSPLSIIKEFFWHIYCRYRIR